MPNALADSAVELGDGFSLSDSDLGLDGVAVDDDGETAIVYGANSYLRVLDANDPTEQIDLVWPGAQQLLDADFHPSGQTAFIVGEDGLVLRYAKQDHSVEKAAAESLLMFSDLTAVSWNTGGSWAYVGSVNGEIWRLRADSEGGAEIHELVGIGQGPIAAIDCHPTIMMCVVAASIEGIGIIDRDHAFTWVGGNSYPWTGVECPTGDSEYCVAVADNKAIALIELDPNDLSKSIPQVSTLPDINAYFIGINHQESDRTIIATTPANLIEHDISKNASYPWLEYTDINDINLTNGRIVGTWATGDDSGWIVTNRGYIVSYAPPTKGSASILNLWVVIAIPIATGLVVLSLVYASSPKLQYWWEVDEAKKNLVAEKRKRTRATKKRKGR
jgi:hypothetical protein